MKRAILAFTALALLAGCAGQNTPDRIVLTRQSRESQDWGRFLPDIYSGLTACLAAHPVQPAYATDAVPQNHGMILVRLRGADHSLYECSTGTTGHPAPTLTAATPQRVRGPAFTPASMPEPYMRCGTPQPVLSGTGRLLGWLTYFTPDCPPPNAAAETGWRAFGNEPFWSLRISGDNVIFDRLGELPQSYRLQQPSIASNRQTWVLDGENGQLDVTISTQDCGDTMASRNYPYTAEVRLQDRLYRGCAEKTIAIP
ncbi:MAG: hypothetical protein OJJ21_01545 [Ferrovibrio sp.]|uniref:COG3650 family protein n=1 Tax=Ferrovibrio sp. TaxID=1917215 RepID=UPI0026117D73|nr:hypothetical protein [Ferrovibrio sp.]MCW0232259.1 hypothetical protein [Ferrovibrio sp.]